MNFSKKALVGMVLGSAAVVTSSYVTARRYMEYRQLKSDVDSIPWDVPEEYSSWRRIFSPNTNKLGQSTTPDTRD